MLIPFDGNRKETIRKAERLCPLFFDVRMLWLIVYETPQNGICGVLEHIYHDQSIPFGSSGEMISKLDELSEELSCFSAEEQPSDCPTKESGPNVTMQEENLAQESCHLYELIQDNCGMTDLDSEEMADLPLFFAHITGCQDNHIQGYLFRWGKLSQKQRFSNQYELKKLVKNTLRQGKKVCG